jgi:hypothetical protein
MLFLIIKPSTLIIPYSISFSAYLLEQIPILANLLETLSGLENSSIFVTLINSSKGLYADSSLFFYLYLANCFSATYAVTKSSLNLSKFYSLFLCSSTATFFAIGSADICFGAAFCPNYCLFIFGGLLSFS